MSNPANIKPFIIQLTYGDEIVLAPDEETARDYANEYFGGPKDVVACGWFLNLGWDRDHFRLKREFTAATGMSDWWENASPPADTTPTKKLLRGYEVVDVSAQPDNPNPDISLDEG